MSRQEKVIVCTQFQLPMAVAKDWVEATVFKQQWCLKKYKDNLGFYRFFFEQQTQRKADRKSGLFFLSLLCRIYGNTAPRSGRGKCTCVLMSERSERIVGFKHKVLLMFRREQAPPYGKRCRLRSKVMSKQSERVVRFKTGRRSRQKNEAIALGLLRWCISYYFLSFYIRSE